MKKTNPVLGRTRLLASAAERKEALKKKKTATKLVAVPAVPDKSEDDEADNGANEDKIETSSVRSASKRVKQKKAGGGGEESGAKDAAEAGDNKNGKKTYTKTSRGKKRKKIVCWLLACLLGVWQSRE